MNILRRLFAPAVIVALAFAVTMSPIASDAWTHTQERCPCGFYSALRQIEAAAEEIDIGIHYEYCKTKTGIIVISGATGLLRADRDNSDVVMNDREDQASIYMSVNMGDPYINSFKEMPIISNDCAIGSFSMIGEEDYNYETDQHAEYRQTSHRQDRSCRSDLRSMLWWRLKGATYNEYLCNDVQ